VSHWLRQRPVKVYACFFAIIAIIAIIAIQT
jgi:hypothetical protein